MTLPRVSERTTLVGILVACLALSALGMLYAYLSGAPEHGGRGGAIAVALALTCLFALRTTAVNMYEALTTEMAQTRELLRQLGGELDTNGPSLPLTERLDALEARLRVEAEGTRLQNKFLAWSTAIGTLVWGFGDAAIKIALGV